LVKWGTQTLIPNTDEPSPTLKMPADVQSVELLGVGQFLNCPSPKKLYNLNAVLNGFDVDTSDLQCKN